MIVWRISNHTTLDGRGGLRASARWHTKGRRIIYCAPNPATALLELLVHAEIDIEDFPRLYRLLKIDISYDIAYETITIEELPTDWTSNVTVTRRVGNAWLGSEKTAVLHVPSAIVPETSNVLINPAFRRHVSAAYWH